MNFHERLKGLRIQSSMTQKELGIKAGVSEVTVRNWESGIKQPSMRAIISLSSIFGTSSDFLLGISNNNTTLVPVSKSEATLLSNYRELDYYGRKTVNSVCRIEAERIKNTTECRQELNDNIVYIKKFTAPSAAGYAAPIEGDEYELIPMDGSIPSSANFAVKIQGNSMAPYINDGDIVYVKKTDDKLNIGDVGIFCIDGCTYCKIFYEDSERNITLVSANPEMRESNVYISCDSGSSIVCFGKVILQNKIPFPDYFNR